MGLGAYQQKKRPRGVVRSYNPLDATRKSLRTRHMISPFSYELDSYVGNLSDFIQVMV